MQYFIKRDAYSLIEGRRAELRGVPNDGGLKAEGSKGGLAGEDDDTACDLLKFFFGQLMELFVQSFDLILEGVQFFFRLWGLLLFFSYRVLSFHRVYSNHNIGSVYQS